MYISLPCLRCAYDDGSNVGITHVRVLGAKVVVARLAGYIEFFEVGPPRATGAAMAAAAVSSGAAVAAAAAEGSSGRRYHVRTGSAGSWDGVASAASEHTADEEIVVNFLQVEMRNFS